MSGKTEPQDQEAKGDTDNEAEGNKDNGNEQKENKEETITRAPGLMSLQKQSQKRYNNKSLQNQSRKEYDVFHIIEETGSDEGIMMLQIDPGNADTFDADKATANVETETMNEEYIYLTEDLG